ncbi:deoxyribodipyrimidine photo-lyase [Rhodonellum psychrophilum GCM71 = DSM 17998]|uniref:Deoxyribodipyrimidine photo-lyase n=2 Tax=Rhodonellum TaxID=336827 RepID=U5C422_9BACT|nr:MULTISPECIES: deoxyribodipyrimidine photo-lyase [Rhodonellum]ERM83671.1 deoxyribodipyrimidine photo-lyase [Rhodonellum psychrophilum GCM71 = DSM 17998]SDY90861.1 deoxyribodipyrimidine photo-lyase [Rhodonellum ikkaensis]
MEKINIFWFRRDLRLEDNTGLYYAYTQEKNVLPLFIFDKNILDKLEDKKDARVEFIHNQVTKISRELEAFDSSILVKYGKPEEIFRALLEEYEIQSVYTNRDYEPYAKERDSQIEEILNVKEIPFLDFKDQVIFEKDEIQNGSGGFYKVFTPYSRVWKSKFQAAKIKTVSLDKEKNTFFPTPPLHIIGLEEMGFEKTDINIPDLEIDKPLIQKYDEIRNFPAIRGTSRLGIHLRFGTISVRKLALEATQLNETFLNELIWREFYMMILSHNPAVVDKAFKPQYDTIPWRNDEEDFQKWCNGKTGYPIVDAGMRELNTTGFMHNRVRMIVASFLTKHLLIDWRWGEAYFAQKLLDFELSSNNGGWQWAAGTGTDAQPYFRVFNPESQTEKFDKEKKYIKKWIPEFGTSQYPKPMVDHKFARERALETYKKALNS